MNNSPTVSVLMPVYNAEKHLKKSIDSILNQTFEDFEFIVVNDGSNDKTVDIIQSYKDPRIRLFHLPKNAGVAAALNEGLSYCRGKYIARMDADDWSHPERFEKEVAFLERNDEYTVVKSFVSFFADNKDVEQSSRFKYYKTVFEKQLNDLISWEEVREKIYWFHCVRHGSIMIRGEILKKIGYKKLITGEDYKLFYDLNKSGHKFGTVCEVLSKFRITEYSATVTHQKKWVEVIYKHIKKKEIEKLFESQNVFIWGTGGMALTLFDLIVKEGRSIVGFIDNNNEKAGNVFLEHEIYPPSYLRSIESAKIIVAASPVRDVVADQLNKMGYSHLKDYIIVT